MQLIPVTEQLPFSGTIAVKYNLCEIYLILFKISRVGILPFFSRTQQCRLSSHDLNSVRPETRIFV